MKRTASRIAALFALALAATGALAGERLKAVATFSILGDMVANVAGPHVELVTLVGADGDAHVYTPTPRDAMALARADILFVNGLGFEGWIDRLIAASGTAAPVVVATDGVQARAMGPDQAGDDAHAAPDPHAWQSLTNGMAYVDNIAAGLARLDPANAADYRANAAAYKARLQALHDRALALFAAIPAERRKVVTSHDAFGYFERTYGVEFLAPMGVSTEGDPSVADVARLIRQIKAERLSAVFMENIIDPSLVKQIARETHVAIGGRIYSDALSGPAEPAATYLDMFTHNIDMLARAMAAAP